MYQAVLKIRFAKILFYLVLSSLTALIACSTQPRNTTQTTVHAPEASVTSAANYDANSWKKIIADSCTHFYDGCNHCQRSSVTEQSSHAESPIIACTRKFCANYSKPYCADSNQQ